MTNEQLIEQALRLAELARNDTAIIGIHAQVCEFFRNYAGPKSSFYTRASTYSLGVIRQSPGWVSTGLVNLLHAFADNVRAGLQSGVSPERRAQLDVVSDFLDMANTLLETKNVHPAAPAVLIGATVEEFLRTWVEEEGLTLGARKPGLESYSQLLREADLLTKQDGKDITAWAGIRNHAAHGEWNEVSDPGRIRLMLEGVNLFMRKYSL